MTRRIIYGLILTLLMSDSRCAAPESTPAGGDTVIFVIEAFNAQAELIHGRVSLTITTVQTNGKVGNVVDPDTGEIRPGPIVRIISAPHRESITMGPGIAAASVTAVYLGVKGEILSCHVERDGAELPGSRSTQQLVTVGLGGRGSVQVSCQVLK